MTAGAAPALAPGEAELGQLPFSHDPFGFGARHRTQFTKRASAMYLRTALALFGATARTVARAQPGLSRSLERALIPLLPDAYLALSYLTTVVTFGAGVVFFFILSIVVAAVRGGLPAEMYFIMVAVPAMLAALTYVGFQVYPAQKAHDRRRDIEARLPYAVNYAAAMAGAGVLPSVILADLARQPVYGEVAREASWIHRDMQVFGENLPSALARAVQRTASERMRDFLSGARTSILSGGDLKSYMSAKAEQYMAENRRKQKEFLEGLSILAESYVTVVIAGPLFLLVMMSVMLVVSASPSDSTQVLLFALIFLGLPVSHVAFAMVVRSSAPEA